MAETPSTDFTSEPVASTPPVDPLPQNSALPAAIAALRDVPLDPDRAMLEAVAARIGAELETLPAELRDRFSERLAGLGGTLVDSHRGIGWVYFGHALLRNFPSSPWTNAIARSIDQNCENIVRDLGRRGEKGASALAQLAQCLPASRFPQLVEHAYETGSLTSLLPSLRLQASATIRAHADIAVQLVRSPISEIAMLALDSAPHVPHPLARKVIRTGLTHSDAEVRSLALRRITFFPENDQARHLARALHDPDPMIASESAVRLARLGRGAALQPLLQWMSSPEVQEADEDHQIEIYQALAESGRPEALIALEQRLQPDISPANGLRGRFAQNEEADAVLTAVVDILVETNTVGTWDILQRGGESLDPAVKKLCRTALERRRT